MIEMNIQDFVIYGLKTITNNKNEQTSNCKIPELWDKAQKEVFNNMLSSGSIYGVYSNYESDVNGNYTLLVGTDKIENEAKNSLVYVNIEGGRYLKFVKTGDLPSSCIELWQEIWDYFKYNTDYSRAYTTDFEKYTDSGIEIYIAIK